MSGVVGIKTKTGKTQKLFYSLSSIQHRGQDASGIILSTGSNLRRVRGLGLVNEIFADENLEDSEGEYGLGHVRSAQEGCNQDYNVEPLVSFAKGNEFSLAHDGNLVNYQALKKKEEDAGMAFHTYTDSELILLLIRDISKEI